jgi:hypothetical protein
VGDRPADADKRRIDAQRVVLSVVCVVSQGDHVRAPDEQDGDGNGGGGRPHGEAESSAPISPA